MEPERLGSGNRICTVVFVDLVQYSAEPVSKQVEMKARFSALLAAALEHTPVGDRVVVDTGDGAALCFLGDPEDALFAANSLRNGLMEEPPAHGLRLRLGINLGPVRVVKDINGHTNVLGDGINVAQRVMSFAAPNQILVSRSYYEVVSRLSPEYGQLFNYAGLRRDKHVREHEVYEVQLSPLTPGAVPGETAAAPAPPTAPRPVETAPPAPRFDAALLDRLTSALAREIGPVARLVVGRAASSAEDARALCATLAESVPEASRDAFLSALTGLVGAARAPSAAPGAVTAGPAERPAGRAAAIAPALLTRAEQLLSRQIGPLARILVREAARQAESPRDLFERLAVHIDNEDARKLFVAEAERPGPGE